MTTKGPSLDAIKRFKEQQERKKREEDERKIKDKLSTLEHRSTHGDRKAKQELKKIRDTIEKPPETTTTSASSKSSHKKDSSQRNGKDETRNKPKPKTVQAFDFDKLMEIAQQNANRDKSLPSSASQSVKIPKKKVREPSPDPQPPPRPAPQAKLPNRPKSSIVPERSNREPKHAPQVRNVAPQSMYRDRDRERDRDIDRGRERERERERDRDRDRPPRGMPPARNPYPPQRHVLPPQRRPMPSSSRYEDEYESDGFVVSDEEYDARAELSETLRSVFRYDRRRCDLREQELDRQYRAIGNVSTFEDLEREERRASRLAAAEDARALREDEERKRLKKLRLDKANKESGGRR